MAFTIEEDEILIDTVAENPILYDLKLECYRDGRKKLNVWKDIAGILNKTADECKKRWKYIKDSYNRYKRKKKAGTGSSAIPKNSKWEFYERLQFLDASSYHRRSITNVTNISKENPKELTATQEQDSNNSNTDDSDGDLNELHDTQLTEAAIVSETEENHISQDNTTDNIQKSSQQDKRTVSKPNQRKKRQSNQDEFLQYMKEREKQRQTEKTVYDDDVRTFGDHVRSVLQKLPQILKVKAKTEIFNTLSKYELLALESPNATRATSSNSNYSTISTFIIPSPVNAPLFTHEGPSGNEYSNDVHSTIFKIDNKE